MARPSAVSDGEKATGAQYNALRTDMVSQTDTNDQNIASDLIFASGKKPTYDGSPKVRVSETVTGTGPMVTYAHGKGSPPDGVSIGVKGAQPYSSGWDADATNIYVYVSVAGPVTVSIDAWWD